VFRVRTDVAASRGKGVHAISRKRSFRHSRRPRASAGWQGVHVWGHLRLKRAKQAVDIAPSHYAIRCTGLPLQIGNVLVARWGDCAIVLCMCMACFALCVRVASPCKHAET
jgi:hypothetical protein